MSDAEIKATASLDDKITPGLNKIDGHLQKFALSADGITSKLARSFSATDLAVGALIGSMAALTSYVTKITSDYEKLNRQLRDQGKEYDRIIDAQDRVNKKLHEADAPLAAYALRWARIIELISSGIPISAAFAQAGAEAASGAAMAAGRKSSGVSGGWSGGPDYTKGDYAQPPTAAEMFNSKWRNFIADREKAAAMPSRGSNDRQFFDPGAFPDTGLGDKRWFASYNRYRGSVPDMNIQEPGGLGMNLGKAGDAADRQLAANERLADSMMKAQKYTDTLAQGLSATFSGMLFDGMKLSDGLKGIFRGLVDDILGELSAKAASSIVKAVLTLADTGGGAVGVQVGPAAINTTLQTLDYQRARGR